MKIKYYFGPAEWKAYYTDDIKVIPWHKNPFLLSASKEWIFGKHFRLPFYE